MLFPTTKTLFVALIVFLLGRDLRWQWPPTFIVVLLDRYEEMGGHDELIWKPGIRCAASRKPDPLCAPTVKKKTMVRLTAMMSLPSHAESGWSGSFH